MSGTAGIPDAEARRRALDPGASFIVQAPAGSGKTELLAQRYLALLARVQAPEEIVAITFTRKAAGEMRNRILAALDRAREEAAPEAAHERRTWELARAVLEQDARRDWQLQLNPRRLRIQTIDSLCAELTRQMPLLSRFGAPPGVVEDASALYVEAARATLAELETGGEWSPAVEHLLHHLDNDLAQVEELIVTMLERRDQWTRHVVDRGHEREALEAALAREIGEHLAALAAAVPPEATAEIPALARFAAANLERAGNHSPITAWGEARALPAPEPAELARWRAVAGLLLTGGGEWRRRINKTQGFPPPSAATGPGEKARFEDMKARHGALMERLQQAEDFRRRLHRVRELPPPAYTDEQWRTLEALFELLRLALAQLELVFQSRNSVDFTAMAQAALQALGEPEAPTDLALALDYRIHHILMDEFQDTSLSQYRLMEKLTLGWEPGDGRTLFCVGDPMQSIYRFREADVGLYLQARRRGIGQVRLEPLGLSANFRSQQGVVDWVNAAFARVFPSREDAGEGAVPYAPAVAVHAPLAGEGVCFHPFLGADPEAEAEKVLALVQAALAAGEGEDVAVLVRNRGHLARIVPHLKQAGLKFRAIEIEHLGHRPVVQDLLALSAALAHPADRVAWLAVLRAPWCGLSLADLYALCGDAPRATLWSLIREPERAARLSAEGRERLARLAAVLEQSLARRGRCRLRRWVEGTWIALGGPACLEDSTDLEDALVYFDLLDQLDEGGGLPDLEALKQRVEALYAMPDVNADGRLQLMTIHKAKGLEFDTVIVPGLGRRSRSEARRLLLWQERPRDPGRDDLLLAPIARSGGSADALYTYLNAIDKAKGRHEDARLLYVAATRARKRLHLLGHVECSEKEGVRPPPDNSLLARLWPVVAPAFEELATGAAKPGVNEGGAAESRAPLKRFVPGWRPPAPPPAVAADTGEAAEAEEPAEAVEYVWAGDIARPVGILVHRLLETIAREGVERYDAEAILAWKAGINAALMREGLSGEQLEQAVQRTLDAVSGALNDERGRWLLRRDHRQARSEYPLTGIIGGRLVHAVIDRTFVDEQGVRWIVDYKTGVHGGGGLDTFLDREQERYREQLEGYAALMRLKAPGPIRLGLYFPAIPGWRQWDYEG